MFMDEIMTLHVDSMTLEHANVIAHAYMSYQLSHVKRGCGFG